MNQQNTVAIVLVLLLGIPHGAIDNSLFLEQSNISTIRFFALYIGAIGLNVLLWFLLPSVAFISFILLSAYHFGQSQFSTEINKDFTFDSALFLSWGTAVIVGYMYFNLAELNSWIDQSDDLGFFQYMVDPSIVRPIFQTSLVLTGLLFLAAIIQKKLKIEQVAIQVFLLVAIIGSAYLFSFVLGFALFFVVIHSFRVMQYEFKHFYDKDRRTSLFDFLKKLAPLSILSFFGLGILFALIQYEILTISYTLILLIAISSITLPHAYVMERFYKTS